ncbi:MAG TPA: hypothetical protein PLD73_08980 [Candidatus Hydrogenedentes bacterium]|jgi:hypothetical protein|nr:hypothetical protein [Candidatus Hydrogenedentota bacterium]
MRSCLKTLMVSIGIVLILIAILLLLAATQLKTVARSGIERTLSFAFLTDVSVESVDLVLQEGHVELHNLTVNNPASFRSGPAMELGTIVADLDLKTLFSATPTLRSLVIRDVRVNLRHELAEGANLVMLARHASRFSKPDGAAGETADKSTSKRPARAAREFIIQELRCEGATVLMSSNLIPLSRVQVEVAPFTITEFSNNRPVSAADLSAIFIRSLIRQTLSTKGLLRPIADLLRGEEDAGDSSTPLIEEPEPQLRE